MTRDRPQRLRSTLARLAALPERPPVIVVDNASRFGLDELTGPALPDCRVLRLPRNIGAVARNLGVAAARTPYVAFADDDSWWAPGALTRAESHFAAHPRLALIAARLLVGPAERLDPVSAFMSAAPVGRQADLPGPSVLGFLACAALVRKDAFLASGGFDPVVFFMGEESRVAYDLTSAGWGLSYCHDVVAHHHPEPGPQPARKRMLAARNAALTAWMRRPARVALARTVTFLREGSWRYRGSFAWRLPQALALRRRPDAKVEAMCEVLERADPTR
jgi:GT2 family glycosyltransferase